MKQIYEKSLGTIVWLGPAHALTAAAFSKISTASETYIPTARQLISTKQDLKVLWYCEPSAPDSRVPFWTPDWQRRQVFARRSLGQEFIGLRKHTPTNFYKASVDCTTMIPKSESWQYSQDESPAQFDQIIYGPSITESLNDTFRYAFCRTICADVTLTDMYHFQWPHRFGEW
jgi:hypothetical protein